MNKLIVDSRIGQASESSLKKLGFELIKIPENNGLDMPICAHPDMLCVKIHDKWFVDSSVAHLFDSFDKTVINRGVSGGGILKYPKDVGFNCAAVGNNLICNAKYTHDEIISYANEQNMNIIDVKQGYSKCSVCIVTDNSIITEDASIAKAAGSCGIDVLTVEKGHVELNGYDYGFIGGTSGLIDKNKLAFNGDIKMHPNYNEIYKFCSDRNIEIISLCDTKLYDIGSILII